MTSRVVAPLLLCALLGGCRKRAADSEGKTELRDQGTLCLRVIGTPFLGTGMRTVEATVTTGNRARCTEYDVATCSIAQGPRREVVVESTFSLFPPYGRCSRDGGAIVATCSGVVPLGDNDVVFGGKRTRVSVEDGAQPTCIGE